MTGKIVILLMIVVLVSLNIVHAITLHGELLRWIRREDNEIGAQLYLTAVAVIVGVIGWLV